MSGPPSSRLLVIVLSAALAAALLTIAFLLGRESARAPVASEASAPAPPTLEPDDDLRAAEAEERRWPAWADLEPWEGVEEPTRVEVAPGAGRVERRPDGTILLSNRGGDAPASSETNEVQPSPPSEAEALDVSTYFLRMDTIRSESGAGDPNTFAMQLIKGAMNGSTEGFDELIADTRRMEAEAEQVTPPPSAQRYHQANLEALSESREVLEAMRDAIAGQNIHDLMSVAQRAGALQHKARALEAMRKQIYTDAQR